MVKFAISAESKNNNFIDICMVSFHLRNSQLIGISAFKVNMENLSICKTKFPGNILLASRLEIYWLFPFIYYGGTTQYICNMA